MSFQELSKGKVLYHQTTTNIPPNTQPWLSALLTAPAAAFAISRPIKTRMPSWL